MKQIAQAGNMLGKTYTKLVLRRFKIYIYNIFIYSYTIRSKMFYKKHTQIYCQVIVLFSRSTPSIIIKVVDRNIVFASIFSL